MIIGYDAKRAFQNRTGLGNYSRTLLLSLNEYFPGYSYFLFAPKETSLLEARITNSLHVLTPQWLPAKQFPSLWRRFWMTRDLKRSGINIYHGLSNEMPAGVHKTAIRTVVTIHDLIFEKHPHLYHRSEVWSYRKKFRHACEYADAIIATSEHTKKDIVELYQIDPDKIDVCYQSCDKIYWQPVSKEDQQMVKKKYQLPDTYFLYVGSITERKNLIAICKAMYAIKDKMDIPLVVVGEGKKYKKQVQQWLANHGLSDRVHFLSETPAAKESPGYQTSRHFPAIYKNALALIYPSLYEGFGIPILEALVSGTAVIAAKATSLPEVGGNAALYFQPGDENGLCDSMLTIAFQESLRQQCIQEARKHTLAFSRLNTAEGVIQVYKKLL
jgi:glycosyltransferase involved in cell wall biosynthesis